MCKPKNETIVSYQFMPPVCMTRHTRPTYFGKASTKKQSEYKLINWCPDSLKVFVWRVLCAAHFLSVYFVIYLFILSSNWFFISCCSCSMRCHFFWILPAQTKRVSSSTIVCVTFLWVLWIQRKLHSTHFFSHLAHHLRNRQTFPPWV